MNKDRRRKLHEVYKTIPKIECQGLCTNFCDAIGYEKGELEEMTKAAGGVAPALVNDQCNYLQNGRCSVYEDRPAICRAWGVISANGCPHGCKRERMMSPPEILEFFRKVKQIAGDGHSYRNATNEQWEQNLKKKRS